MLQCTGEHLAAVALLTRALKMCDQRKESVITRLHCLFLRGDPAQEGYAGFSWGKGPVSGTACLPACLPSRLVALQAVRMVAEPFRYNVQRILSCSSANRLPLQAPAAMRWAAVSRQ